MPPFPCSPLPFLLLSVDFVFPTVQPVGFITTMFVCGPSTSKLPLEMRSLRPIGENASAPPAETPICVPSFIRASTNSSVPPCTDITVLLMAADSMLRMPAPTCTSAPVHASVRSVPPPVFVKRPTTSAISTFSMRKTSKFMLLFMSEAFFCSIETSRR